LITVTIASIIFPLQQVTRNENFLRSIVVKYIANETTSMIDVKNVTEKEVTKETFIVDITNLKNGLQNESNIVEEKTHKNYTVKVNQSETLPIKRSPKMKKGKRSPVVKTGNLEFIHITKTGGTTIEKSAAEAGIRWGACLYGVKGINNICNKQSISREAKLQGFTSNGKLIRWHVPPHWFVNNPLKNNVTFTVVRNPYTRAISEYYCKYFGYKGKDINNKTKMNNWIRMKAKNHRKGNHMSPQYHYVYNKHDKKIVDHVLRFENLTEEFNELMKKYFLNITLGKKTNVGRNSSSFSVANLTRLTIKMINSVYAEDFKFFNYSFL